MCNRKETTWWEPCGQIWTECGEWQSSKGDAVGQKRLWRACKGVQALAPPGFWKKIWGEEIFPLSICLPTDLSHTTETSTLSRIKWERYIFIKKCVRSFIEVVNQCYDYGYTTARISLTLSRHFSRSFITSSGLHPVSSHSCCMYVRAGRPAFARPYVGVHRSTSLMSSSLLLQQVWDIFL